ncbi:MAG: ferritin-like domain-containing protein [Deltaproteobacteria bacterium]|nr:ferritin-like domain-containing protein [Deltaproteobacteria bacterium]
MGWMELRGGILVALGLVGCVGRELGDDSRGDDAGDDGASSDDDGTSDASTTVASTTVASTTVASTTVATSDSGDDGPGCMADPEAYEQVAFCVAVGDEQACGDCSDAACRDAAILASGACFGEFQGVLCGPERIAGQCCYVAEVLDQGCAGRPLLHAGTAVVASTRARDDWGAATRPGLAALDADARARACAAWREVAVAEHASIASFARFTLDLLAHGAPAELVLEAQQAMGDEVVHARLAFGLAGAYAGASIGPDRLRVPEAGARTLEAAVVAAVLEGCVGETIASARAGHARDAARDPAVIKVLTVIARDERRHAQLAWRFVAWALRRAPQLADAVAAAFDGVDPGGPGAGCDAEDDLRAHGILPVEESLALGREVLRDVVRPCAATMLRRLAHPGARDAVDCA